METTVSSGSISKHFQLPEISNIFGFRFFMIWHFLEYTHTYSSILIFVGPPPKNPNHFQQFWVGNSFSVFCGWKNILQQIPFLQPSALFKTFWDSVFSRSATSTQLILTGNFWEWTPASSKRILLSFNFWPTVFVQHHFIWKIFHFLWTKFPSLFLRPFHRRSLWRRVAPGKSPMALKIFEIDSTLRGCEGQIWDRVNGYRRNKGMTGSRNSWSIH